MLTEHTLVPEMLVFAKVVELRGLPPPRQLGLTTSAISRSVGRLEAHWGARLLHRTTRSVSLTELGAEVYAGCAQMARLARSACHRRPLRRHPRGTVRISAPVVFGDIWLAPQLPALRQRWPAVEIAMQLSDRMVDLTEEGLDLALRITTPDQLPPGLVARALRTVRYIPVASPAWLQQLPAPITHPRALAGLPCITLGYGDFQNQLRWEPLRRPKPHPPHLPRHRLRATPRPRTLRRPRTAGADRTHPDHRGQQHRHRHPGAAAPGVGIAADFAAEQALAEGRLVQLLPDWQLGGSYTERTAYALYSPHAICR
jgi:DNA-binding transcriptional LysR family regulator